MLRVRETFRSGEKSLQSLHLSQQDAGEGVTGPSSGELEWMLQMERQSQLSAFNKDVYTPVKRWILTYRLSLDSPPREKAF
ncbi:hypothetical protein EYF80_039826 [Liparis tanakae]|uniref:Uncharacterized protein n=1 Tax=Liparis tanakae TaxID=230148 RepID=A0A4Z2G8X3_9TELE|nr:hypothetical protein EYF80_039826 [Liparis tanakae]